MTNLVSTDSLDVSIGFLKDFPEGFERGQHQKIEGGFLIEKLIKTYGKRLTYNLLSLEPEIDGKFIDVEYIQLFYAYLSIMGWKIDKNIASDCLLVAARQNIFHPVNRYLEKISQDPSIKPINIETLSSDYLGSDSDLYNQILKTTLLAAVGRVVNRGIKFDNCCVLLGKQGAGKSTFWKTLASDSWFCDTWQTKEQDLFMAIQCTWIYEIAELDRVHPNSEKSAKLKAILSSSIDRFKRPYGKAIGCYPRPSILVSSCNRRDFLNDPTGSRRFWVIDLEDREIDNQKVLRDRDRIWKSIYLAYKENMVLDLPLIYREQSFRENLFFEEEHHFLSAIANWLDNPTTLDEYREGYVARPVKLNLEEGFTTKDAIVNAKLRDEKNIRQPDYKGASDCLRKLGYELGNQERKNGKRIRLWRKSVT